jgi:hypothetical protein
MPENCTELLLLPDGRVMVHNLTPAMAGMLKDLDHLGHDQPSSAQKETKSRIRRRAKLRKSRKNKNST